MPPQARISNIDLLRGLVMIIMALDHTRDFIHAEGFTGDPLNLETTTPLLYITRWITHLCAPTFVFLSGTSVYLQSLRKSKHALSIFLFTRGLWLIFVEVAIITLAITFDISYSVVVLQVIWAIGISMVIFAALIRLPFFAILFIGVIVVAGHNLLDIYEAGKQDFPLWYSFLHRPVFNRDGFVLLYPFLPWTGLMLLGYCFGRFYLADVMNRHKRSIMLGLSLIAFFIVMRFTDVYGDPIPWSSQKNALFTVFSFINTQKYPPSLLYLSITIGISLVILGLAGDTRNSLTKFVEVFGQVPLFYYILHFYLIHIISAILYLSRGHSFEEGVRGEPGFFARFVKLDEGYSLAVVYLVWIFVVLVLYPVCRKYASYKLSHRKWWLSYL